MPSSSELPQRSTIFPSLNFAICPPRIFIFFPVGAFPMSEQHIIRNRLAKSFRAIVSQRLIPKSDGKGRVAIVEILKSTLRTRDYVEKGEQEGKTLLEAMADGDTDGMQHFDGEIEKLVRAGVVEMNTGLAYATNPGNLALLMSDMKDATTAK